MTRGAAFKVQKSSADSLTRADWKAIDDLGIRRLTNDSRTVRSGDTFVAYPGYSHDGRDFIGAAVERGAASVLWERSGFEWSRKWQLLNLGLRNLRRHTGEIADRVYGRPSTRLRMIGVTGTNGKTTCSHWIAQALTRAGRDCAIIGTLGFGLRAPLKPIVNTTPDALWLHAQLAEFARRGAQAVAMEVSSIGLDQDRVAGVDFDVALFTNLTRDHLEYHHTLPRYQDAKARLFAWKTLRHAVVNVDDEFGAALVHRIRRPGLDVVGYGFGTTRGIGVNRVTGANLATGARGVAFDVESPWGSAHVASPVLGRHNAYNLLGTLAVLLATGIPLRRAIAALSVVKPVPGRLQRLGGGAMPLVVVDYAHTPDALKHALKTLRELLAARPRVTSRESRLICVFGCGGDRDRGKRPMMGRVAGSLADRVVVTSDNPRDEEPRDIIEDIVAGTRGAAKEILVEPNRRTAIRRAVMTARRGDIVLLAGKGHENYQEIRGVRRPFSDVEVAREALAGR